MITITVSPEFLEEKRYVLSLFFGEFLGLPFEVTAKPGESGYRISLANGKSITIEDSFFTRGPYFRPTSCRNG